MPPKRKQDDSTPRSSARKTKKTKKYSNSDNERSGSDGEEGNGFDKSTLQRSFKFNFEELMADPAFNHPEFVHTMDPQDLTVEFFEKEGLDNPILFRCDPKQIGMTVPPSTFSVDDVLELVGGNRMIEVVEVQNQGSVKMSLQEFVNFYKTPKKERKVLYNVLSLEFSLTPLENLVKSPSLVRQIDWVGTRWPDALRQRWISFLGREKKYYNPHHTFPKVQNYCLMSVANCYTDFHIDFSGTSVWYHVLRGRKVFWLIPPTETNFFIYQEFIKTVGDNAFFGKSVEKCHVAVLEPGDTMLIPSGWIHAVYTPDDSLVFGGNFLHSQSIKTQIRVYQVENKLNITRKFRLPYNEELLFYVIADYVKKWTGREYVRPLRIEDAKLDYVGERWQAAGGHLRKIVYSDYETGVELPNEMIRGEDQQSKDEVKVIAMHAENSVFGSPRVSKLAFIMNNGLEPEDDEEHKHVETKEEMEKRRDAEIDEIARDNPLIFYKNSKHDFVRNKCVPDHKLPIGHESPICFVSEEISRISPRLLEELEALGTYLRRKTRVEVAEGICQPASLLNAFNTVLRKRRAELEGKPFDRPLIMPRRYTRAAIETGDYEGFQDDNQTSAAMVGSRFKVEDFPDELLEVEETAEVILPQQPTSGPLEYVPTSKPEKVEEPKEDEHREEGEPDESGALEENEEDDEEEEEEDEEYEEEEYVPTAPVTRRSSARKSAANSVKNEDVVGEEEKSEGVVKKSKKEKKVKEEKKKKEPKKEKMSKEQKKKELERRKLESKLDAELRAAHGGGSAKKKKPEKPAYVGGLPTSSIQTEPVVSNPYNYDPKMEMVKLGTGQLKSAYRKTRNNVELRIEKNLYKLEPKRESIDEEDSRDASEEPDAYPAYTPTSVPNDQSSMSSGQDEFDDKKPPAKRMKVEPISVDTVETPPSSRRRESREHRPSPSPYTPSPNIATPSPSISSKPKLSSPAMFSPSPTNEPAKVHSQERRSSESSAAMRKGVYMPSMSRQDKMIAEASSAASSRHSSISSERRPSFIPQISRNSSTDTNTLYTPTAIVSPPARNSWLPNTSQISRHPTEDDSLIDVVNDTPIDVITPPPINLADLSKEITNGRKSHNHDDGKKPKIPAKEAMAELKALVTKLNTLNDA